MSAPAQQCAHVGEGVRGAEPPRLVSLLGTSESRPGPGTSGTRPHGPRRGALVLPKYIRACQQGRFHLRVWPKVNRGAYTRIAWRCRSWRHRGGCAKARAREDFERIWYAVSGYRPQDVVFCVFTLKPGDWESTWQAYEKLRDRWRSLAKALRREFGDLAYVSTVEAHRNGMPHLNVIVASPEMAKELRFRGWWVKRWLKQHARLCGFGWRCSAEAAKSLNKVAGYVVKLADTVGELPAGVQLDAVGTSVAGEVSKLSQVPVTAPKGFRRLRSSPRFLPPPPKNPDWSGELVPSPLPEKLTAHQREAWEYFDKLMRGEVAELPEGLEPTPSTPDPFLAGVNGNERRAFILDVGPPPPGEEWIAGTESEWPRLSARPEQVSQPEQHELF